MAFVKKYLAETTHIASETLNKYLQYSLPTTIAFPKLVIIQKSFVFNIQKQFSNTDKTVFNTACLYLSYSVIALEVHFRMRYIEVQSEQL